VRSCPALTGLIADTMKQLFTKATKKRLRHSIVDFNPSVADSIGTGKNLRHFCEAYTRVVIIPNFAARSRKRRAGNFGDYCEHSAHTLLGANE
jgi:hypothetical protein